MTNIGVLHPGEMGTGIASTLVSGGYHVMWLPEGRSTDTRDRAMAAKLHAAASMDELVEQSEIILSICPPHAALDVARAVVEATVPFVGIYIDANAIAPETALEVAEIATSRGARYVDGAVIGPPPPHDRTRLYLSGSDASQVTKMFDEAQLNMFVLDQHLTAASALKMAYATWTKGSGAMMLAVRALAASNGVEDELIEEWMRHDPSLLTTCDAAAASAMKKGWRWIGEMEEIAKTFSAAHLPAGFGHAAGEVYGHIPRQPSLDAKANLQKVIEDLTTS